MSNYLSSTDPRNSLRLKTLCAVVLSSLYAYQSDVSAASASAAPADASAYVEFESGFLTPGSSQAVDISRFEKGNIVTPGMYSVDLYVNGGLIGRTDIPFKAVPGAPADASAQPCFDKKLLDKAGVDLKKLAPDIAAKLDAPGACLPIGEIINEATGTFDFGDQRLDVSIQQISLSRNARGYVSPEFWDNGVNVGFLNYNFNLYSYNTRGQGTQTQGYLGLNAGANLGDWHFRHNGSYNWDSSGRQQYQNINSYVQRDLPKWSSQLIIGESYTTGELFDSTSFRGVRVATDDRMLPDSLRGYAPTVRGIATSNAKVTIKQNGVTIYETTVAPGAFEIDDLYATGYGGDLNVFVTEADGSVHSFSVPYAAVPLSLRAGVNRYSITAGTVRNSQLSSHPAFVQATWQHGFTNLFTGYAGVNSAVGYGAAMFGGAFNTSIGAIGADYTQAVTSLPGQGRATGGSARISYAKILPETGSSLSLAAYRYSSGGFYDLNTALLARDQLSHPVRVDNVVLPGAGIPIPGVDTPLPGSENTLIPGTYTVLRQRSRAQVTFSQALGQNNRGGQLSLTASSVNYWNRSGSDINYSVGYSNVYRQIGYNVQANRQRSANGAMDTLVYASVTIPLGKTQPMTLNSGLTRNTSGSTQMQSTLTGALGENNDFSYGVTANHSSSAGLSSTGGSVNASYRSPLAQFSATAGAGTGYTQSSIGVSGAVVAHPGGITLSQPLSETFGVIKAADAEGAGVLNAAGVRIDSRGYAVVPYLTPYSMNTIQLDPKGTSTDVELQVTSQQIAPRAGSVPMVKFETVSGRSAVIQSTQPDGNPLPFGATVLDESGQEIGVVGQASRIFARGLQDKGQLTVKWGEDASSLCHIAYDLPARSKGSKSDSYQQVNATCTASFARQPERSVRSSATTSSGVAQ